MFDDETLEVRIHEDEGREMHQGSGTEFETENTAVCHGENGAQGFETDLVF
jgi:hypothetical protein